MGVFLEVVIRAVRAYGADRCSLFAASITYFSLVSLFPLALFAIGVAGFLFQDAADQQRIVDELMAALPLSDEAGRQDIERIISNAVSARGALGVVGLVGTAYTGSALFGALRASLVAVYQKERRRPFFKAKLVDVSLVFGFTTLLLLSVFLTFAIAFAQRFSGEVFGERFATLVALLLTLAYPTLPALVSFLVFFLLYTVVAAAGIRRSDAAWGALVAALAFEALKVGFAQYVAHFGNYDATYGTIGFLVALLAFFNLGAQIMLAGAEVAEARRNVLTGDPADRLRDTQALRARLMRLLHRPGAVPADVGGPMVGAIESEGPASAPEAATEERPQTPTPGSEGSIPAGEPRRGGCGGTTVLAAVAVLLALSAWRRGRRRE